MWTEEQRRIYRREGDGYPSDLRNTEWARLEPLLIPSARPGGRPRKTDMRAAMNAILYLLRTGCPWRYLPRDRFPPRSTVYNIFRKFQRDGVWEATGSSCTWRCASGWAGRPAPRRRFSTANRSNRQKKDGRDGQVGYDAGKKVKGRKIHALVDSEGLSMP